MSRWVFIRLCNLLREMLRGEKLIRVAPGPTANRSQVEHTKTERNVLGYVKHPFIVGLNMAFQTRDKLFFVLDYCAGGELFFHLVSEFKVPRKCSAVSFLFFFPDNFQCSRSVFVCFFNKIFLLCLMNPTVRVVVLGLTIVSGLLTLCPLQCVL